jgi:hypothetical protein
MRPSYGKEGGVASQGRPDVRRWLDATPPLMEMTSDTLITAIDELGVVKAQMAELAKKEKASRISGGRAFARNAALILARVSVEQLRAASLGDLHRAAFLTPMSITRMLRETMIIAFSVIFFHPMLVDQGGPVLANSHFNCRGAGDGGTIG